MKKIFFLIAVLLFIGNSAFADDISYDQAVECAKAFFAGKGRVKASSISVAKVSFYSNKGLKSVNGAQKEPFYVFNNASGKGFVIISGDDRFAPVIGFSDSGSFSTEDMPANFKEWLAGIEEQMKYVKGRKTKLSSRINGQWKELRSASYNPKPIVLYNTAKWDQGFPYYLKTPIDPKTGGQSLTGCTQTALAICMKFFNYPDGPVKDIEGGYYDSNDEYHDATVPAEPNRYKWDDMLLDYGSGYYSSAQADAVATLMADLGIMDEASYSAGGTGATLWGMAQNMAAYMGYSKAAHYRQRDFFTREEWAEMLRNELDSGHPVMYQGLTHAYVVDGYAEDDYFHINWGWGGSSSDGYFIIDIFDPSSSEPGSDFQLDQAAIFGMVPDPEGTSVETPEYVMRIEALKLSSNMPERLTTDMTINTEFTRLFNNGEYDIAPVVLSFNLMSAQHTKACNLVTWQVTSHLSSHVGYPKSSGRPFQLPRIRLGDYVQTFFTNPDNSKEIPVYFYEPEKERGVIPVIDAAYIEAADTYKSGDKFEKTIFYGRQMPSSAVWTIDDKPFTASFVVLASGKHVLKAVLTYADGSKETITREINVK